MSNYIIKKTTPNDVLFMLHPIDNPMMTKKIFLTKRQPQVALPEDWALGVFFDTEVYNMFRKGLFTFNDNDAIVKAAQEKGVYFDDHLDFTPASENDNKIILETLKRGNRSEIVGCIEKYTESKVKDVAIANVDTLSNGVVKMLESVFKVQLNLNED